MEVTITYPKTFWHCRILSVRKILPCSSVSLSYSQLKTINPLEWPKYYSKSLIVWSVSFLSWLMVTIKINSLTTMFTFSHVFCQRFITVYNQCPLVLIVSPPVNHYSLIAPALAVLCLCQYLTTTKIPNFWHCLSHHLVKYQTCFWWTFCCCCSHPQSFDSQRCGWAFVV